MIDLIWSVGLSCLFLVLVGLFGYSVIKIYLDDKKDRQNAPVVALFDIDGVLSIPNYNVEGKMKPGGSEEWWKEFCRFQKHPYRDCGVPAEVVYLLEKYKKWGVILYVLTQETFRDGKRAKTDFISMRYSEFFNSDRIIFVKTNEEKIEMIKDLQSDVCDFNDIEFWDDTYSNVLAASELGVRAHHVSELLTNTLH